MAAPAEDWLSLDLQDRRYVTIVDEETVAQQQRKDEAGSASGKWKAAALLPLTPLAVPLLLTPFGLVAGLAVAGGWLASTAGDDLKVLRIPRRLARGIDFGPHGWEKNVVYAANPKQPSMYRPLADFHEDLLLHKISELERLLNALGALEYSISHIQRKDREATATVDLASVASSRSSISTLNLQNVGGAERVKDTHPASRRGWSGTTGSRNGRLSWRVALPERGASFPLQSGKTRTSA